MLLAARPKYRHMSVLHIGRAGCSKHKDCMLCRTRHQRALQSHAMQYRFTPYPPPPTLLLTACTEPHPTHLVQVTCVASVIMVTPVSGVNATLADVMISGTWTSNLAAVGYPFTQSGATMAANGMATFVGRSLPLATGNGCTFNIDSIVKAGYVLADPGSKKSSSLSW